MKDKIGQPGAHRRMSNASSATNFFPNSLRLMWFDQGCLLNLFGVLLFSSTLGVAGGLVFQSETGVLSSGGMKENYRYGILR